MDEDVLAANRLMADIKNPQYFVRRKIKTKINSL